MQSCFTVFCIHLTRFCNSLYYNIFNALIHFSFNLNFDYDIFSQFLSFLFSLFRTVSLFGEILIQLHSRLLYSNFTNDKNKSSKKANMFTYNT